MELGLNAEPALCYIPWSTGKLERKPISAYHADLKIELSFENLWLLLFESINTRSIKLAREDALLLRYSFTLM